MIWFVVIGVLMWLSYKYMYAADSDEESTQRVGETILPAVPDYEIPDTYTFSPRDSVAFESGSLEWCNEIMQICWPHIGKIMQKELRPTIQPLVNLYLPKPFSKFEFINAELGKDPLQVDKIVVHKRFKNSIAVDLDVNFTGSPRVSMKCSPIRAVFGIKEFSWTGRMTVLLRPLGEKLPLVGAVQAAMITHPELKMNFTGVADVADFGPVQKIVQKVLKDIIASVLVLPNRFVFRLSPEVKYFDIYYPPLGVLCVTIEKGRGFTNERRMGMIKQVPDLYCKGKFALQKMKTKVRMNNLSPEWNCTKPFVLSDLEQPFELTCFDKDTVSKDDLVGCFRRSAQTLLANDNSWWGFDEVFEDKIAKNGEVFLRTQFFVFDDMSQPVSGQCVVSVLLDCAKNLPPDTRSAACIVRVGNHSVRETQSVVNHDESANGFDPANPEWMISFDVICPDVSQASVVLEVVDGRKSCGAAVSINGTNFDPASRNTKEGPFDLGRGATLNAKVMLRGLIPYKRPGGVTGDQA